MLYMLPPRARPSPPAPRPHPFVPHDWSRYPGDSELRAADGVIEAAARGVDVRTVRLHTKCDHTLEYFDFTAADAIGSFNATMQRLSGCGASLHAMRIHDPSEKRDNGKGAAAKGPVDDIAMALSPGGHVAGLVSLRERQKISQVSIGMMADGMPGEHFRSADSFS